ncbi:MAG TPA: hypothetical protein VFF52_03965 [Isosphaeraceae bacterium]|nr:hypothetical protein [Isosphaeraceae bacterium]
MATTKDIPVALLEQLRRDREKIAAELPELMERGRLLDEAAAENSLSGHLRRAIHRSGRPLKKIAAEVGIDVFVLCDFLEGTRTLRSDVLDRLAQAVAATIQMKPAPPQRPESPTAERKAGKQGRKPTGANRQKRVGKHD